MRFLPSTGVFGILALVGFLVWEARHTVPRRPAGAGDAELITRPTRSALPQAPAVPTPAPPALAPAASTPNGIPPVDGAAFRGFNAWLARFTNGANNAPPDLLDGVRLARSRREALRDLIVRDPASALARVRGQTITLAAHVMRLLLLFPP